MTRAVILVIIFTCFCWTNVLSKTKKLVLGLAIFQTFDSYRQDELLNQMFNKHNVSFMESRQRFRICVWIPKSPPEFRCRSKNSSRVAKKSIQLEDLFNMTERNDTIKILMCKNKMQNCKMLNSLQCCCFQAFWMNESNFGHPLRHLRCSA